MMPLVFMYKTIYYTFKKVVYRVIKNHHQRQDKFKLMPVPCFILEVGRKRGDKQVYF